MDLVNADVSHAEVEAEALIAELRAAVGADAVLTSYDDRRFFSEDVYRSGVLPTAVVQPKTVEEVQRCVAACHRADAPIVPRGGGMSYTDGYLPIYETSVTFDLARLDKIVEIRPDDMYVTVEAGCTWKTLDDALAPLGLRALYWGPVSGLRATVGGALSQNSVFWGAVRHGVASGHVLGLDVVLADGTLLGVGSRGAKADAPPFFRHYGPEATGLFTGDCGALGLKVRATLPLIRRPPNKAAISFAFDSPYPLLTALSEMSRAQLISEASMFDRAQQQARVGDAKIPFSRMVQAFMDVAKADGLIPALRMAANGKRFLAEVDCSLHLILEAASPGEIKRQLGEITRIAEAADGWTIEPTIARTLSARPFPHPNTMVSEKRFLPVHGIVPHSIAPSAYRGVMEIFERRRAEADRLDVLLGVFSIAVGPGSILIEPTCHWSGAFLESHPRLYDKPPESFPDAAANPEAHAFAAETRDEICQLFLDLGAGHLQIGKQYPFRQSRSEEAWSFLTRIKALVDPRGLMNPGALGFQRPGSNAC